MAFGRSCRRCTMRGAGSRISKAGSSLESSLEASSNSRFAFSSLIRRSSTDWIRLVRRVAAAWRTSNRRSAEDRGCGPVFFRRNLAGEIGGHLLEVGDHSLERRDLARLLGHFETLQLQCRVTWFSWNCPLTHSYTLQRAPGSRRSGCRLSISDDRGIWGWMSATAVPMAWDQRLTLRKVIALCSLWPVPVRRIEGFNRRRLSCGKVTVRFHLPRSEMGPCGTDTRSPHFFRHPLWRESQISYHSYQRIWRTVDEGNSAAPVSEECYFLSVACMNSPVANSGICVALGVFGDGCTRFALVRLVSPHLRCFRTVPKCAVGNAKLGFLNHWR